MKNLNSKTTYQQNCKSDIELLVSFLDYFYKLKEIKRAGWVQKLGLKNSEDVSDHTLLMIVLLIFLSEKFKFSDKKKIKLIKMILLHDLPEAITGDWIPESIEKQKKKDSENYAMEKILGNIPYSAHRSEYKVIWNEFSQCKSFDSKFIHLIDKLEMVLQARYYINHKEVKKKIMSDFFKTAITYSNCLLDNSTSKSRSEKSIQNLELQEIKEILAYLCK